MQARTSPHSPQIQQAGNDAPLTEQVPPEAVVADLTMSRLWRSRASLRVLARRKAWELSIDDCRAIAEPQVEHLKRCRVVGVTRRVAPAHSMRPGRG
jgi:hypothetical protein